MIKKNFLWLIVLLLMVIAFIISNYYGQYLDIYLLFTLPALLATWWFGFWSGTLVVWVNLGVLFYLDLTYKAWKTLPFTVIELSIRVFIMMLLVVLLDRLKNQLSLFERESRKDNLTGLFNRRGLFELGEREIQRCYRTKEPLTIAMMDIDNFKKINDRNGHLAGDKVLTHVATILHRHLRKMDGAARFGGDEFALVLPHTDGKRAKVVVDRLVELINKKLPGAPINSTITVGCCTMISNSPLSFEALLKIADDLMYSGKKSGKSKVLYKEV